jgi:hypothetical protein
LTAEESAGLSESIERAWVGQTAVRYSANELADAILHRFGVPSSHAEPISDELRRLTIANREPRRPWNTESAISLIQNIETFRGLFLAVKEHRLALNTFLEDFREESPEHLCTAELLALKVQRALFAQNAFLDACRSVDRQIEASRLHLIPTSRRD